MPCNNKCTEWKAKKPVKGGRYENGQIRCDTCGIYMYPSKDHLHNQKKEPDDDVHHGLSCNCCNMRISTRSYSSKFSKYKNPEKKKTLVDIEKYLENENQFKANYQFVIIKTLLEKGASCSFEKIREEIKFYNKSKQNIDYVVGIETLMINGYVVVDSEDNISLNLDEDDYPDFEIPKLILPIISICNKYIYQNTNPKKIQHFTAVGGYDNWEHTMKNQPFQWAITTTNPSNIAIWELAKEGDLV
jgi:hypothetical protein